jgi:hypothetical protein
VDLHRGLSFADLKNSHQLIFLASLNGEEVTYLSLLYLRQGESQSDVAAVMRWREEWLAELAESEFGYIYDHVPVNADDNVITRDTHLMDSSSLKSRP